jgi:hypothetical protein
MELEDHAFILTTAPTDSVTFNRLRAIDEDTFFLVEYRLVA